MNEELKRKSCSLRKDILEMVCRGKTGHIGGDFSVCDILNVLYNRVMNLTPENFYSSEHDHFILSKGHSVEALYSVLADMGFFPKEELTSFSEFGSKYIGHPNNKVKGIELNSGSLGHGLSLGVGLALAEKMNHTQNRTFVVMGDGELAEGSVWEGAMAAGHYQLNHLCAVIDRNRLQISGNTEEVMTQDNQCARWESFGWNVISSQGNNIDSLLEAFAAAKTEREKPTVIIANTIKGFPISFMENKAEWHHKVPTPQEQKLAFVELSKMEESYE